MSRVGVTLGIVVLMSACLPKAPVSEEAEQPMEAEQATTVLAVLASSREIPLIHRSNGEIIPSNNVEILATQYGRVERVTVQEGQKVEAGTQLLVYDHEMDNARLEFLRTEVDEAEAAVDFDQYRFDNRDALLDEEEISSTVFDMLEKQLTYEKARLERARAEVEYLQKATQVTEMTSPIAGVVTRLGVVDGMPVIEGQFLMEVVQDDPVKLRVALPEEFIPATYRGQLLQVTYPNLPEEQTVKITEVGISVDSLTGTFDIFAELDNPESKLKTGMELPVTLATDKKSRILAIPKRTVALRERGTVVFRVEEGVARLVPVKLGQTYGDEVAVERGLEEGEIVVLDPPATLKDGDPVEIMTAAAREART